MNERSAVCIWLALPLVILLGALSLLRNLIIVLAVSVGPLVGLAWLITRTIDLWVFLVQ